MATVSAAATPIKSGATPRVDALDITVLAGGPGAERAISLESGQAVAAALVRRGHRVHVADIGPDDRSALDRPADVVFIALHGEFGEDGTVQAELEGRRIRYCGSDSDSSRIAMDKVAAKRRVEQFGVPTPDYAWIDCANRMADALALGLPLIVKPVASGSSVDTTIARSDATLMTAARSVVEKYGGCLIERYIEGPELTVGILGDRALPVCEIRTRREFYDYQAKYVDEDTQYLFELDLPEALLEHVQTLSLMSHRALGCRVFSRVDWMVDRATMQPFFLEVNTIPGFTSHSLLPKAAARVGIDFDRLCQRIVELSLSDGP